MPFVLKNVCLPTSTSTESTVGEKRFNSNSHNGNLTKKLKAPAASSIVIMDSAPKVTKAKKLSLSRFLEKNHCSVKVPQLASRIPSRAKEMATRKRTVQMAQGL